MRVVFCVLAYFFAEPNASRIKSLRKGSCRGLACSKTVHLDDRPVSIQKTALRKTQYVMKQSPLVSATEALALHCSVSVRFVDATWYLPNVPQDASSVYAAEHIPGAVHFDIDKVADPASDLPHMFPTASQFAACIGEMGIANDDRIIVYDRSRCVASARAWWMFLAFGHARVQVLNGGLNAWKSEGGAVEAGVPHFGSVQYTACFDRQMVISWNEMLTTYNDGSTAVIDARSAGRFSGAEPEPRPNLRGGHIPYSKNIYYGDLMDEKGLLKAAPAVCDLMESEIIDIDAPVVATCGSGVTAAILLLSLYQVRQNEMRLYDGSWTEWALNPDSPL